MAKSTYGYCQKIAPTQCIQGTSDAQQWVSGGLFARFTTTKRHHLGRFKISFGYWQRLHQTDGEAAKHSARKQFIRMMQKHLHDIAKNT